MLFGTYSENRSPVVVLISRWTFAFLLLHNLTAIASYGAAVVSRVPPPSWVSSSKIGTFKPFYIQFSILYSFEHWVLLL